MPDFDRPLHLANIFLVAVLIRRICGLMLQMVLGNLVNGYLTGYEWPKMERDVASASEMKRKFLSSKIEAGVLLPYLDLPSNRDGSVNLWDFKQKKNLVIIFHHGIGCSDCRRKLRDLAEVYVKAKDFEAEFLAVSFDSPAEGIKQGEEDRLPFPLLSDLDGEATGRFTHVDAAKKAPYPSIFISDRFGVLRYQKVAEEAEDLPAGKEILDWLLLIECECPECSHL